MRDEGVRNRTVLILFNNCYPKANIMKAEPLNLVLILTKLLFSSVHLFSQSQDELDVNEKSLRIHRRLSLYDFTRLRD
jgi:hypothetical protein